jgi:hypothetical protein
MWEETRGGVGAFIFSILSAGVRGYDTSSRVLRMMLPEKGKAKKISGTYGQEMKE